MNPLSKNRCKNQYDAYLHIDHIFDGIISVRELHTDGQGRLTESCRDVWKSFDAIHVQLETSLLWILILYPVT